MSPGGDLLLVTREHFDPPALLRIDRVVSGVGRRRGWDYARATRIPGPVPTGADLPPGEPVVLRRRSGKRWTLPKRGEEIEVEVWQDPDPAGDAFEQPPSGAGLFVVLVGSLEEETARWERSRNPW